MNEIVNHGSMVIFASMYEAIEAAQLSNEEKGILYTALVKYGLDGTVPELDNPKLLPIFLMAQANIKSANQRYAKSKKCAVYGHLGGAPKGNKNRCKNKDKQDEAMATAGHSTLNANVDANVDADANADVSISDTHKHGEEEKSLEERRIAFANELLALKKAGCPYNGEQLDRFYMFWSETDPTGRYMRKDSEKFWNTVNRLARFNFNLFDKEK